jgi:P27 family predicted phage terminase small subunit
MPKRKSSLKPTPPDDLKGEGLREWDRVCDELHTLGRLNKVDRALLTTYCRCWATFCQVSAQVDKDGPVTVYSNGNAGLTPYYKAQKETAALLQSLLAAMGLTPAARDFDRDDSEDEVGDLKY